LRKTIIIELTDDPNEIDNYGVGTYKLLPNGNRVIKAYCKDNSTTWNKWAFLCAIHEMVEFELTQQRGIIEPSIDSFDNWFNTQNLEGEPGDHKDSPYKLEHRSSEFVERYLCEIFGMDWFEYFENYKIPDDFKYNDNYQVNE